MTFRPLLLTWPLTVQSRDFRPVRGPVDTASDAFGSFEFDPPAPIGSTVVAMTSLGMAVRSRPDGPTLSRSIPVWKDAERGLKEIELSPDADAVLRSVSGAAGRGGR